MAKSGEFIDDFVKTESSDGVFLNAKRMVQWALQESYPMAVKLRGITDWSRASNEDARLVEEYQLKIAELLAWAVRFP